jgi:hypothetical protein
MAEYRRVFGADAFLDFPVFERLKEYTEVVGEQIRLNPLGLSLSDYIGTLFISDEVKEKMATWA